MADVRAASAVLEPVLENFVRTETVLADQGYKGSLGDSLEKAHQCILGLSEKLLVEIWQQPRILDITLQNLILVYNC